LQSDFIIDDPLKPDEARSDVKRARANAWFDQTVSSRLNDKKVGAMVIIMQWLHQNDLVGHALEKGDWETLVLPAIAEHEQTYEFENVFGRHRKTRYPGDVLHPAREPQEILNQLKVTLGEYNFAGQYQQAPAPMGGGIFKRDWIEYYEPHDKPGKFQQVIQSWDTANKETELADYSVCTTWGIQGSNRYLLDVTRAKMDFPTLKRAVVEQIQKHRPQLVLIEDKASGTQLIQELRSQGHSIVKEVKPQGDKFMRARAQTASFEGGFVKLPRQAIWLDAYVQELLTFPRGRYDDQVDSTVQALAWCAVHGVEPGLLAYYRQMVEGRG
jgi:predicted phage terminase large subunit-like protein